MRIGNYLNFSTLLLLTTLGILIAVNVALPYPDSNDYQGLARICLLMDGNIKYCVNNNWGFAHPLSCWLLTNLTGDLLLSQRLLNAFFMMLCIVLLLRMERVFHGGRLSAGYAVSILIFIFSPWMLDAALSVHMDIIPITLMFAAVSVIINRKSGAALLMAGILAGASYWFRFHFLTMALIFPLLAGAVVNDHGVRKRGVLFAAAGVVVSVLLPHILCMLAYGVFGISNQRFVLAYALGAVDWTYESAVRLSQMTTADMFRGFDAKRFVLSYGYHFLTSGCFPLLLIVAVAFRKFLFDKRGPMPDFPTGGAPGRAMLLVALWAAIAVIPFTIVRGFTFRLEAAFVFFTIPLVVAIISGGSKKTAWMTLLLLLPWFAFGQVRFWGAFCAERAALSSTERIVARTIPKDALISRPGGIINCAGYYNPHNAYRLCNPVVFAGWGVRFNPFIDQFGLLNLTDPFDSDIYKKAEYLILPTNPEADVFTYSREIIMRNRKLFENDNIIVIQKETGG